MKKLSVLIALLLCVTIGGVYATWTYAGTDDIADVFAESKVTIADATLTGANGVYTVTSNLVLTVDQANEDHEALLKFASNDGNPIHLTITFKPANNAPKTVKENAVPTRYYFGTTTTMAYKMDAEGNYSAEGTAKDIFTFDPAYVAPFAANVTWTPGVDEDDAPIFTYTLNEDALKTMITLNGDFVLDTKAEHDAFRDALSGNIVVRVTDGTVTQ
ncbi:MAG: hypothetical protein IJF73_00800 [Clostridia bacterium]|nr:hypothetical protein [Clostridia bacterium]